MSASVSAGSRAPAGGEQRARWRVGLSAVGGAALGAAPHVLHHAGPVAGAALLAGAAGAILFGLLGLVAAIPLMLRLRRRTGSWRTPLGLLAVFAAVFAASTAVVGPALSGSNDEQPKPTASPSEHEEHHP